IGGHEKSFRDLCFARGSMSSARVCLQPNIGSGGSPIVFCRDAAPQRPRAAINLRMAGRLRSARTLIRGHRSAASLPIYYRTDPEEEDCSFYVIDLKWQPKDG